MKNGRNSASSNGVNPPLPRAGASAYCANMKRQKLLQDQNQKPVRAAPSTAVAELNRSGIDCAPSVDEVARRAYFSYLNEGSLQGHDVQHWLQAEAQLFAGRNSTPVSDRKK